MIDIAERHLKTIRRILGEHAAGCEVRAFGSRVSGTAKDYSDLDLAIIGEEKLPRRVKMLLREAFEESDPPFRVDIVDYNAISDSFRSIVDGNYEIVQSAQARLT
jgi:type I restriction enzyme S subunit